MKLILNSGNSEIARALGELANGADELRIAVSYVQTSGWAVLRERTCNIPPNKVTLVFTDQFDTTHPAAIKEAIREKANVRVYSGAGIYHPKVFVSYAKGGKPIRYLLGSANLSRSALEASVEACVIGDHPDVLAELDEWLSDLIEHRSIVPTEDYVNRLARHWQSAAHDKIRPVLRKAKAPKEPVPSPSSPFARDALDTIFSTVPQDIITLGFDLGGNTVRSLRRAMEVLQNWKSVVAGNSAAATKQRSELNTLGLLRDHELTKLGHTLLEVTDREEFAAEWCRWLQTTKSDVNPRLRHARNVFSAFWSLKPEVREFYGNSLQAARKPKSVERVTLQAIEVLCNVCDFAGQLDLDEIHGLRWIVDDRKRLPTPERAAVEKYVANKGERSWDEPDRRILPSAWKAAAS